MGLFTKKDWRDPYRRMADGELLERICTGDKLAEEYLMETYLTVVLTHMQFLLRGKPQQLGDPGDYAHDAILLLLDKARYKGAAVLKHEHSRIGGWIKQAAANLFLATIRKDRLNDRDQWQSDDDTDGLGQSLMSNIEDEGADDFAKRPEKDKDQISQQVMFALPEKLQILIRLKFMDGFSWKETSEFMERLFPDNDPPFELAYLQKTYWDRIHKKPFYKKLTDAFKRNGYDI